MIRAVKADIECDLQPLSNFFHRAGIRHRIIEESGKQVICVFTHQEQAFVASAFDKWEKGELNAELIKPLETSHPSDITGAGNRSQSVSMSAMAIFLRSFSECPVTYLLVFATVLVAVISRLGAALDPVAFLFYPDLNSAEGLASTITQLLNPINFVRAIAPMLLHFGEMHIVFNLLWLAVFGRQIEEKQSSIQFLLVVACISFIANTVQFLTSYQTNFGGMSGVVYGLLGYIWVWQWIYPREGLRMQQSMYLVFIVALVVMAIVASSVIATPAHIGGLVAGSVIGAILALAKRLKITRAG